MPEEIIKILISSEFQERLIIFKILFFLIDIVFISFIIFFFFRTRWFKLLFLFSFVEFLTMKIYGINSAKIRLGILKLGFGKRNYKKTILKLYNSLDKILEGLAPMYQANTFSERLAKIGNSTFSNTEALWEMHEICRKIKKEPEYQVDEWMFSNVVKAYEQAINDLDE